MKDPAYSQQYLYLTAYSDFHKINFQLGIEGEIDHSLTPWQIVLIVIASIAAAVGLYFFGRFLFRKWLLYKKKTYLFEEDVDHHSSDHHVEEE